MNSENALRARLVVLFALAGGLWLWLDARLWSYWMLDLLFFVIALLLWLGRSRPESLLLAVGIVVALSGRPLMGAFPAFAAAAALVAVAPRLERRLRAPSAPRAPASKARLAATLAVSVLLISQALIPTLNMVSPERRRRALVALSPSFPVRPPESLTPLAAALRGHVVALSQTIGERSVYQPDAQDRAKDYVVERFRAAGYAPTVADFPPRVKSDFVRRQPYRNVEARLGPEGGDAVWVVGAHYDSAPGTPGADDNASGVAVLLETARLLKAEPPKRGVVFVAFDTEEPPSFGTRDMGSQRCVEDLRRRGVKIRGFVGLEMLGYFNDKPRSQLFAPFMGPFYPDRGNFLALVSNLRSAGLAAELRREWRKDSTAPLQTAVLPSVLSTVALSDQLNFWSAGEKAVMLSDTSYFRYPHYHQSEDTEEKLDYERMAEAARALAAVLRSAP